MTLVMKMIFIVRHGLHKHALLDDMASNYTKLEITSSSRTAKYCSQT